jgi:hypothetical protein
MFHQFWLFLTSSSSPYVDQFKTIFEPIFYQVWLF